MQSNRFRTGPALAAIVFVQVYSGSARADEPKVEDACVAANDRAIDLRGRHQLLEARAAFLECAAPTCPGEVRDECSRAIDGVNAAIPTIVLEVKDAGGHDVDRVSVTMDGKPFAAQLEGVALPVDPGRHTFSFSVPGESPVSRELLIVEGARGRRETIAVGSTAHPSDGTVQRILGWSAVGLGAVGVGLGIFFETERADKQSQADAICPTKTDPSCAISGLSQAQSDAQVNAHIHDLTSDANSAAVGAAIAFAAGGVFMAGGLALVLTAPAGEKRFTFTPVVAPGLLGTTLTAKF